MSTTTLNKIGVLAYFRGKDVWVTPDRMRALLVREGYDPAVVPTLDPVARARQAAGEFRTGRINGCKVARVELLRHTQDEAHFGILWKEEVKKGEEVQWKQHDSVSYHRATGWSTPITKEGAAFIEAAKRWQTHLDYRWLRDRMVLPSLSSMGGFSINASSGFYYVHSDKAHLLDPLRRLVADCGKSALHLLRIEADPDTRAAVADAAQETLGSRIEDIQARLSAWSEKARGRAATVDGLISELADVRAQAIALSTALSFSAEEIQAKLLETQRDLEEALADADDRGPVPAPKPVDPNAKAYSGLPMADAAAIVLSQAGQPLHYREITKLALEQQLFTTTGSTPWETMNAQLCVRQLKDRDNCAVIRVSPGVWGLRPGAPVPPLPQGPQNRDAEVATEPVPPVEPAPVVAPEPPAPEPVAAATTEPEPVVETKPAPELEPAPQAQPEPRKGKGKKAPEPEPEPEPVQETRVVLEEQDDDGEPKIPPMDVLQTMAVKALNILCRDLQAAGYSEMKGWSNWSTTQKVTAVCAVREARGY